MNNKYKKNIFALPNLINSIIGFSLLFILSCAKDNSMAPTTINGKGGSMARFTIAGDYLYIVDRTSLKLLDISQPAEPKLLKTIELYDNTSFRNSTIETIFYYNQKLFIGSNTGFFIFDVADLGNPKQLSVIEHIFSCDPVVVNDSLAFVTLRSNTQCRTPRETNQLEIYDISNPKLPIFIENYSMKNPHGVGIHEHYLFLCQANYGLEIYDFTNPRNLERKYIFPQVYAYDVIPNAPFAIITATNGIFQYNISRLDSIYLVSQINTQP